MFSYINDAEESYNSSYGATMFEMRAAPRRRKETDDQPLFLRKAFNMITSCPSNIGLFFFRVIFDVIPMFSAF